MKKTKAALIIMSLFILSIQTYAGHRVGNGGDAVVLKDDTVILADPYLKRSKIDAGSTEPEGCRPKNRKQLHPLLIEELKRISDVLVSYGAAVKKGVFNEKPFISVFIGDHVLSGHVTYCFVDELPLSAKEEMDLVNLPDGAVRERLAVTRGSVTWIKQKLFLKMNIREQAKTIIHERLHSVLSGISYEKIVGVTDGIEIALSLLNKQLAGERPVVSENQFIKLNRLRRLILDLSLFKDNYSYRDGDLELMDASDYSFEKFKIVKNGGGMVAVDTNVDPSAYISIGSMLPKKAEIRSGVELINSKLCFASFSRLITAGYTDYGIVLDSNSKIENAWFGSCRGKVYFGKNSTVKNSSIILDRRFGVNVWLETGIKILDSDIRASLSYFLMRENSTTPIEQKNLSV